MHPNWTTVPGPAKFAELWTPRKPLMMASVETGLFGPHLELCHTSQEFEDYHASVAAFEVQVSSFGLIKKWTAVCPRKLLID
jgi:hypothetical protein